MTQGECSICYEFYDDSTSINTNCNHIFHNECLQTWISTQDTCPLCRRKKPLYIYTIFDAIVENNIERLRDLIQRGADVNCRHWDGRYIGLLVEVSKKLLKSC
jgi:hypothetical protein